MDQHRTALGLAVGPADLDLLPLTVRWVYATRATPGEAPHAPKRRWPLSKRSATVPTVGWQTAHVSVWRRRAA